MTREVVCHGVEAPDLGLIDVTRYIEGDTLDIEWEHIWRTQWLLAGLVSDVREPGEFFVFEIGPEQVLVCLLYTSPSPRDATLSRMPSSA